MIRKPKLSQLVKYDVDQKIVYELADLESRTVLFSIKRRARLAEEISEQTSIPLSTVYLKLNNLLDLALIFVERIELSEKGRRLNYFRSRISEAEIILEKSKTRVVLVPNKKRR